MGACFSSDQSDQTASCYANLVSFAGELRQYPIPVTVSQVLAYEACSPDSFFVCSSDALNFEEFIPSLASDEELEAAQIYFVLPISKLKSRLAPSDMAAMAVKASVALNAAADSSNDARISAGLVKRIDDDHGDNHITVNVANWMEESESESESTVVGIWIWRSKRKSVRYDSGSRRSSKLMLSLKIKLSTINEESVLVN